MSTLPLNRARWARPAPATAPRLRPAVGVAAFTALALATGVLCMVLTRGTTFQADEWVWAMQRRGGGLGPLLDSWNGHFSLVPVLVYKLLWATAGLTTYVPYRLVITVLHVLCGTLVFVYGRRRVGDLLALAAAAVILTFGPGWQDFLWPFQLAWLISVTAGVGALLALDRGDRKGAIGACALLCCSVASSGPGVAILAGTAVEVALAPDRRRRWWVIAIPLAIYGAWWLAYQKTTITGYAVRQTPAFVVHLIAATFSSLAGIFDDSPGTTGWGPSLGVALALVAVLLAAWRLRAGGKLRPRAAALIAIVVLYAVAVAVNRGGLSSGADSRYVYVAAVFVVLAACELARDVRPGRIALLATAVAVAVIVGLNLDAARTAGGYLRSQGALVRADLASLDIGQALGTNDYVAAHFPGWPFIVLHAADYYALRRALGSPAASPASLRSAPETARETADVELIGFERVKLVPGTLAGAQCRRLSGGLEMALPSTVLRIASGASPTVVTLRRFARTLTPIGVIPPGAIRALSIRPDGVRAPWYVRIDTRAGARVCGLP